MTAILAIARRELGAFFASPIGWICLSASTFIGGLYFTMLLFGYYTQFQQAMFSPEQADQMNVNDWVVQPLYNFLSVVVLFLTPLLSMRLVAEDRRQRSMELLLTSPISSLDIAAGKLLGALGFAGVMALSTLPYLWIVYTLGEPDTGVVLANLGSYVLILGALLSVGLFASSLTENQIVAAVISFVFNLFMWIFGFLTQIVSEGTMKEIVQGFALLPHAEGLGKGLVHLTDIVYFVTFIGFFLFATTQRVEALRWR